MKMLSLLFVFTCTFLTLDVQAQSEPLSKEVVVKLICHKWRAVEMVSGTMRMPVPADGDYTLFRSDFTHEQKQDGTVKNSTWKYEEATRKLIFASGDEYTIKSISATRMELGFMMEGKPVSFVFRHFGK